MAGVTPADIDVRAIYDCYTYTTLITLEDYGFCAKGEGGALAASGALGPGGDLPTNTGGGQLSSFYLWGMTPAVGGRDPGARPGRRAPGRAPRRGRRQRQRRRPRLPQHPRGRHPAAVTEATMTDFHIERDEASAPFFDAARDGRLVDPPLPGVRPPLPAAPARAARTAASWSGSTRRGRPRWSRGASTTAPASARSSRARPARARSSPSSSSPRDRGCTPRSPASTRRRSTAGHADARRVPAARRWRAGADVRPRLIAPTRGRRPSHLIDALWRAIVSTTTAPTTTSPTSGSPLPVQRPRVPIWSACSLPPRRGSPGGAVGRHRPGVRHGDEFRPAKPAEWRRSSPRSACPARSTGSTSSCGPSRPTPTAARLPRRRGDVAHRGSCPVDEWLDDAMAIATSGPPGIECASLRRRVPSTR